MTEQQEGITIEWNRHEIKDMDGTQVAMDGSIELADDESKGSVTLDMEVKE